MDLVTQYKVFACSAMHFIYISDIVAIILVIVENSLEKKSIIALTSEIFIYNYITLLRA